MDLTEKKPRTAFVLSLLAGVFIILVGELEVLLGLKGGKFSYTRISWKLPQQPRPSSSRSREPSDKLLPKSPVKSPSNKFM
jgi:hypothetical protein